LHPRRSWGWPWGAPLSWFSYDRETRAAPLGRTDFDAVPEQIRRVLHRYTDQITPIAIKPEGDKETRLSTASLVIEQGKVLFPKQAPWLDELLNELLRFPQTQFDDQADSVSQYLNWDRERGRHERFEVDWM
jgi:predicted phage terminase large subunit-like protein